MKIEELQMYITILQSRYLTDDAPQLGGSRDIFKSLYIELRQESDD